MKNKILSLLLSVLLVTNISNAGAHPPDQPLQACDLKQAEEFYYKGEFDQALTIIEDCLKNQTPDVQTQIRAYTISTRILLARNDSTAAEINIMKILALNPSYSPSIEEETPRFVNFVAEIRKKASEMKSIPAEAEADSSQINPWIWIGAGGAAIAIFAIFSRDKGGITPPQVIDQTLPAPPSFPNE